MRISLSFLPPSPKPLQDLVEIHDQSYFNFNLQSYHEMYGQMFAEISNLLVVDNKVTVFSSSTSKRYLGGRLISKVAPFSSLPLPDTPLTTPIECKPSL